MTPVNLTVWSFLQHTGWFFITTPKSITDYFGRFSYTNWTKELSARAHLIASCRGVKYHRMLGDGLERTTPSSPFDQRRVFSGLQPCNFGLRRICHSRLTNSMFAIFVVTPSQFCHK